MSEKNGSFDEALRIIEKEADMLSPYSLRGDDRESLYQAIRVLEAAGKIVDRRNEVLECLSAITPSNDGRVNYIYNSVRGLLESLPEKEEK